MDGKEKRKRINNVKTGFLCASSSLAGLAKIRRLDVKYTYVEGLFNCRVLTTEISIKKQIN